MRAEPGQGDKSATALGHRSLAERAADAIMGEILQGHLAAQGALPSSRELARRYGVSVIVIREALAHLQARGALDRRQGRRTRVVPPNHSAISSVLRFSAHHEDLSVDELQACRAGLEIKAAELAAGARRDDKGDLLTPPLQAMRRARSERAFNDNDVELHLAVAELSGNRPIQLILAALREVTREVLDVTYGRVKAREGKAGIAHALELHERIVEAVLAGDAPAAAQAMRQHFEYSGHGG